VIDTLILFLFYFYNQQFITQNTRADHGSYDITIYKKSRLHEKRNREKEKAEKEERKHRKYKDKKKRNQMHIRSLPTSLNYLIVLSNTKALLLNSKKMK